MSQTNRYQNILVATDFSPLSLVALETAHQLAKAAAAAELHLVHVVPPPPESTMRYALTEAQRRDYIDALMDDAKVRLSRLKVPELPGVQVSRAVRFGVPARELAGEARGVRADLVVLSSHGYGSVRRAVLGSVASALIRVSECPVLVVGEDRKGDARIERILVAVDLSPISARVLRHAFTLARGYQASVHALSLYDLTVYDSVGEGALPRFLTPEEQAGIADRCKRELESLVASVPHEGVPVEVEVIRALRTASTILKVAAREEAGLITIGTTGHNAWERFLLGSTATKVLSDALCPVLVVPNVAT